MAAAKNTDAEHPVFCLRHILADHSVKAASVGTKQRAHFAERLQELASQTWEQLRMSDRHAQGFEMLPASQVKPRLPGSFSDAEKVMVFRYSGKLPMIGVRAGSTYHVLGIEAAFGDLYEH